MKLHRLNRRRRRHVADFFRAVHRMSCKEAGLPQHISAGWLRWHLAYFRRASALKAQRSTRQVLTIIDLQCPQFVSAEGEESSYLIKQAVVQIKLAKKLGWPIIFVEYAGHGDTHPLVLEAINQPVPYDRFVRVHKCTIGGGKEVLAACREHGFSTDCFRLIGVYMQHCVHATAYELHSMSPKSRQEIVRRACCPRGWRYWVPYANTPGVILLPAKIVPPADEAID